MKKYRSIDTKYKITVFILVLLMVYSFDFSNNRSLQESTSNLTRCTLTFGIPNSASQWEGDNILSAIITIYTTNKSYKSQQEFRNQPIGPGHAVYLEFPFSNVNKAEISKDKVEKIEITLKAMPGSGGPAQEKVQFRIEAGLDFEDGTMIATGYPEPAPFLFVYGISGPKDGKRGIYTFTATKPFYHKSTLHEPIR